MRTESATRYAIEHDHDFARQLQQHLGCQHIDPAGRSPRDLAAQVARHATEGVLIFINVDLACKGFARYEQGGVEVLKFLRLTDELGGQTSGREAHCVLYSFRSLAQLIRERPASAIICSEGTTFCRLPFDPRTLSVEKLVAKKARLADLKAFIRGSFTLPDERHSWANWWSAWQMLRVYEQQSGDHEVSAGTFLLPTSDTDVRDALFAYGNPRDIDRALRRREEELTRKRARIEHATVGKPIGLIDDLANEIEGKTRYGWQRVLSHLLRGSGEGVVDLLAELEVDPRTLDAAFPARAELQQADLSRYACVLLDLRLRRDERGPVINVEDLSGAKVLGQIRGLWPMLPVIVTTASNKVRTYEKLMELGADAYWIKQGPDEHRTGEDLVEDYDRLLSLVEKATTEKYQFAYRLGQELSKLYRPGADSWWDDAAWFTEQSVRLKIARNGSIKAMILDLLFMLRQHLHCYEMGYGYKGATDARRLGYEDAPGERLSMLSIIQHAGKMIEAIHGLDLIEDVQERNRATVSGTWRDGQWEVLEGQHWDWFAYYLLGVRNRASHYGGHEDIDWDVLKTFLIHLTCYLRHGPPEEFYPPRYSMANDRIEENAGKVVNEVDSDYVALSRLIVGQES